MSFDQPVILERSAHWSRVFVWLILGMTTSGLVWVFVAKIEHAVPAAGKLEPQGSVKEIKAPTGGVVRKIVVQDGQRVKKDQLLLTFDPTAPEADLASLTKLREALVRENQFYKAEVNGNGRGAGGADLAPLTKLRDTLVKENQFYSGAQGAGGADFESLTKLRATLVEENQFYKAQIDGLNLKSGAAGEFNANQQRLLAASRAEYQSRVAAARLQVNELEKQLSQTQGQLPTARKLLALNQAILNRVRPVIEAGALSKLQYERQQQDVLTRQAEVDRLTAEQQRLTVGVSQAREQMQNTISLATKDILTKIADNQKQIAEIDTQHSATRLDNQKKIAEIDGQLAKAKLAMQYQELRAPSDGVVFDLKPRSPGFVANSTEPILKIVPNDNLVASVFLTNRDIGFVQKGMETDVKIESFPESEFGSIKGKLVWIGSDALAPTTERPFYAFPAAIQLERQSLLSNGKELSLQSGMAVNCSIKVRKRTVLSIFTNMFEQKVKSLETVR